MGAEGEMGRSRSDDILCDDEDEALEAIVRWADEASRRVAATVDGQSSAAFLCSKVGRKPRGATVTNDGKGSTATLGCHALAGPIAPSNSTASCPNPHCSALLSEFHTRQ